VFFALRPRRAVLSDTNSELMNCYVQVRERPHGVIERLGRLRNTQAEYYRIRAAVPRSDVGRAARLIYLTTLSFNGIYRVNLRGEFNVPYGCKVHLAPCDPAAIMATSEALAAANLLCGDFEASLVGARRGDFVYLDPPYTVAHGDNGFLKYNSRIFSWEDQRRLATVAADLVRRGCRVAVSNADHPCIRELYRGFRLALVERPSVIAASGAFRRRITECVFYNEG